jgi:hypothetical protein
VNVLTLQHNFGAWMDGGGWALTVRDVDNKNMIFCVLFWELGPKQHFSAVLRIFTSTVFALNSGSTLAHQFSFLETLSTVMYSLVSINVN